MTINNNFIIPIKFSLIHEGLALDWSFEILLNYNTFLYIRRKTLLLLTLLLSELTAFSINYSYFTKLISLPEPFSDGFLWMAFALKADMNSLFLSFSFANMALGSVIIWFWGGFCSGCFFTIGGLVPTPIIYKKSKSTKFKFTADSSFWMGLNALSQSKFYSAGEDCGLLAAE